MKQGWCLLPNKAFIAYAAYCLGFLSLCALAAGLGLEELWMILGAIAGFLGTAYLIYVAKRTKN